MTTQTSEAGPTPEGVGEQDEAADDAEPDEHAEHALHAQGRPARSAGAGRTCAVSRR